MLSDRDNKILLRLYATDNLEEAEKIWTHYPNLVLHKDKDGYGLLHQQIHKNILQWALDKGLAFDEPTKDGRTPIFYHLKNRDNFFLLLNKGADCTRRLKNKNNLLHEMLRYTTLHEDCTLALLERGVQANGRNSDGETSLHVLGKTFFYTGAAALLEHYFSESGKIITHLMRYGCNINAQDSKRNTALHLVQHKIIAEMLLDNGADPLVINNKSRTPLEHLQAKQKSGNFVEPDLLALLEKWTASATLKNTMEKTYGIVQKSDKAKSKM